MLADYDEANFKEEPKGKNNTKSTPLNYRWPEILLQLLIAGISPICAPSLVLLFVNLCLHTNINACIKGCLDETKTL